MNSLSFGKYHDDPNVKYDTFRPTTVYLSKTPLNFSKQKWGNSDDQNLHRIGGKPSWIQGSDKIVCPDYKKQMVFLLQIDSGLPTMDGKHYLWGSGSVLYIFWCDTCKIDGQVWQCT